MRRYDGKVALCAGSATGLGAAAARRLAREGAKVAVGDINLPGAQQLVEQIAAEGGEALAVHFDITEPDQVKTLVERTVERFGRLDVMHVNATDRLLNLQDYDAVSTELEVFDRMHSVSLRGHLLCTRYAVPELLKTGGGAIVYTSSMAGKVPPSHRMSYAVAKAGLNGLMRHVAARWGKQGLRANSICPGIVLTDAVLINTTEEQRTDMQLRIPSPRLGDEQDIAALVTFLLSDEAGWINGQAVSIDGGAVMSG